MRCDQKANEERRYIILTVCVFEKVGWIYQLNSAVRTPSLFFYLNFVFGGVVKITLLNDDYESTLCRKLWTEKAVFDY